MKNSHLLMAIIAIIGIITIAYCEHKKKKEALDLAEQLKVYANDVEQQNKRLHNHNNYLQSRLPN